MQKKNVAIVNNLCFKVFLSKMSSFLKSNLKSKFFICFKILSFSVCCFDINCKKKEFKITDVENIEYLWKMSDQISKNIKFGYIFFFEKFFFIYTVSKMSWYLGILQQNFAFNSTFFRNWSAEKAITFNKKLNSLSNRF